MSSENHVYSQSHLSEQGRERKRKNPGKEREKIERA